MAARQCTLFAMTIQPDQAGHAAGDAVAAIGINARAVVHGAPVAAVYRRHMHGGETLVRELIDVRQPTAGRRRTKSGGGSAVALDEGGVRFRAHLERVGPDRGAEPSHAVRARTLPGAHGILDHAVEQAAPAGMDGVIENT